MEQEILELLRSVVEGQKSTSVNWTPIVSTVSGGLLALLGSFGVQWIQFTSTKKKEEVRTLRDKLEEIGSLSNEFEDAIQLDMAQIYGVAGPDDTMIPPVHQKLRALSLNVNLYHKKLSEPLGPLEESCMVYFEAKRKIVDEKNKLGNASESALNNAVEAFQSCISHKKYFLDEVVGLSSYWGE